VSATLYRAPARSAPAAPITFASIARATAGLSADFRCELFGSLLEEAQESAWRALAADCDRRNAALNRAAGMRP
jgi:hypothetical protein